MRRCGSLRCGDIRGVNRTSGSQLIGTGLVGIGPIPNTAMECMVGVEVVGWGNSLSFFGEEEETAFGFLLRCWVICGSFEGLFVLAGFGGPGERGRGGFCCGGFGGSASIE